MSRDSAEQLRRLYNYGTVSGLGEPALLDRFVGRGDPTAFEAIVARHGPMVRAVCLRILRKPHDVDDAFQATFLVLARKARSLRNREALGPWLYGVAYKVACRARARSKAPSMGLAVVASVDEAPGASVDREESAVALHEELARLSETYRAPVLLCYFEGPTHDQAAERLNWPVGTVRGRLSRARDTLRARLHRRGLCPSAMALLDSPFRSVGWPTVSIREATRAALAFSAKGVSLAAISPSALSLAKGSLNMMAWNQWKVPLMISATLIAAATGTVLSAGQGQEDNQDARSPFTSKVEDDKALRRLPLLPAVRNPLTSKDEDDKKPEGPTATLDEIDKLKAELDASLPAVKDGDLAEKARLAQESYDRSLTNAALEAAGRGADTELLEGQLALLKEQIAENAKEIFGLDRSGVSAFPDEGQFRSAQNELTNEAKLLESRFREAYARAQVIRRSSEAARERLQALKGRPRPVERLQLNIGDYVIVEVLEALPGRPISGVRPVRADGKISLGFYGEVYVAGLALDDVKEKLVLHLRKSLDDETLGLIVVDIATGKPSAVAPKDTGRMFVDIVEIGQSSALYRYRGD